jgi:hypothetical protein
VHQSPVSYVSHTWSYGIEGAASNRHRDWRQGPHDPCLVLTSEQAAEQLRMVDKGPAQHTQGVVFESTRSGAPSHQGNGKRQGGLARQC